MENIVEQFTDRIIKVRNNRERYIYVLLVKDSTGDGSKILYIEQDGMYSRTSIKFGSDYAKFLLIPITEEIEAYNKYFYQFFEPTERMKNYIKKMEENKK
ncbi:MAG: hypothetical protein E6R13_08025 [Spirochaetes bacterium]|nr:MAG: hypothetical protein E6R13_08025 [Spirochaetota bacterium]